MDRQRKTSNLFKMGERKGEKEGRKEGLKEAILLDTEVKFGRGKVQLIRSKIEKVEDMRKLRALKIKVIKARSWDGFLKLADGIFRGIGQDRKKSG